MAAKPAVASKTQNSGLRELRALSEAQGRVRELEIALADANTAMNRFRCDHMVSIGTQLYFRCGSIDGRAKLDVEWTKLVRRRDQLLTQWNEALKTFSEVKMQQGGNTQ